MSKNIEKNDLYGFRYDINKLANILFNSKKGYKKALKGKFLFFDILINLFLISLGDILLAVGIKSIILPHGFMTGGFSGVSLLLHYSVQSISPGLWFTIINIPIFITGWFYLGRRFFLYSLYGMFFLSLCIDSIQLIIPVQDAFLSVLSGGTISGIGMGLILRSRGSSGGVDIIGIILNKKFRIKIGTTFFIFNLVLFGCSFLVLSIDAILYSIALSFIISQVFENISSTLNQQKTLIIITNDPSKIANYIHQNMNRGVTFLYGSGAYSKEQKKIILTVINNYQVKRLEDYIMKIDSDSFIIIENTYNIIGRGF